MTVKTISLISILPRERKTESKIKVQSGLRIIQAL